MHLGELRRARAAEEEAMAFVPSRCPNTACPQHREPEGRFYYRHGVYRPRCRDGAVPRFRCRRCGKAFSPQTFRHDYRDRKPEHNELVFHLLSSGVGLRQIGRVTGLAPSSVQMKMRKMGRTCRWLHRNLCRTLPAGKTYLLDEEETYEGASIRTVTMPVVIERESWFVIAVTAGPTRRLAARGTRRRLWQERDERRRGRRRDRSKTCVRQVLNRLRQVSAEGSLVLRTDEKSSYRAVARQLFGDRLLHETTLGSLARTTANPLFAINTTIAMTRDNCGRLRRRSWLVSKRCLCLRLQMHVFVAYRNYVRQRFNRDADRQLSSAASLGLLPRALSVGELLRWRQDWGQRSNHPLSFLGERAVADSMSEPA
ncbi:MAG: hypothetical protein H6838_12635 [Planctomycetes bacterium]|nr:hypothetical protein [Planctomycetota bacterium]